MAALEESSGIAEAVWAKARSALRSINSNPQKKMQDKNLMYMGAPESLEGISFARQDATAQQPGRREEGIR
jgi:hypothetical protein